MCQDAYVLVYHAQLTMDSHSLRAGLLDNLGCWMQAS